MKDKYTVSGNQVGFFGLLGIAFIILKVIGLIDWDWVWVLAPLWVPFVLFLLFMSVLLIIVAIGKRRNKR